MVLTRWQAIGARWACEGGEPCCVACFLATLRRALPRAAGIRTALRRAAPRAVAPRAMEVSRRGIACATVVSHCARVRGPKRAVAVASMLV